MFTSSGAPGLGGGPETAVAVVLVLAVAGYLAWKYLF